MEKLLGFVHFEDLAMPQLVWLGIVALLSLSILITSLKGLSIKSSQKGTNETDLVNLINVECYACGWKGEVPRLRKRCPNCGADVFPP